MTASDEQVLVTPADEIKFKSTTETTEITENRRECKSADAAASLSLWSL
jgi:hypothetical protein